MEDREKGSFEAQMGRSTGHSERLRTSVTETGGALENGGLERWGEAGFGGRKGKTQRRKVGKPGH